MNALKTAGFAVLAVLMIATWIITLPFAWLHARCSIDPGE